VRNTSPNQRPSHSWLTRHLQIPLFSSNHFVARDDEYIYHQVFLCNCERFILYHTKILATLDRLFCIRLNIFYYFALLGIWVCLMPTYSLAKAALNGSTMNVNEPIQSSTPPHIERDSALTATFRAAYSSDGKYIAFIGSSPSDISHLQVCVYDAKTWNVLKIISLADSGFSVSEAGLAFSPDNSYLAFGLTNLFVWRVSDWTLSKTFVGPYIRGKFAAGNIQSLAFSPDGRHIAVLYSNMFWPPTVLVRTPEESGALQQSTLLSIRSNRIPEFTRGAAIIEFDVNSGNQVFQRKISDSASNDGTSIGANKIVFSNDGRQIITAGRAYKTRGLGIPPDTNSFVLIIDSNNGRFINVINDVHSDILTAMTVTRDGKALLTGTNTGQSATIYNSKINSYESIVIKDGIRKWSLEFDSKTADFGPVNGQVREIYMSEDGKKILVCHNNLLSDAIITVWDAESGNEIKSYRLGRNVKTHFMACAISPDGRTVVVPELRQLIGGGMRPDRINIIHVW